MPSGILARSSGDGPGNHFSHLGHHRAGTIPGCCPSVGSFMASSGLTRTILPVLRWIYTAIIGGLDDALANAPPNRESTSPVDNDVATTVSSNKPQSDRTLTVTDCGRSRCHC